MRGGDGGLHRPIVAAATNTVRQSRDDLGCGLLAVHAHERRNRGKERRMRQGEALDTIVFGRVCSRHCVASTCSTSEVPMPNASAPNAPCVEVWESPQTIVIPGWVMPSWGPIT